MKTYLVNGNRNQVLCDWHVRSIERDLTVQIVNDTPRDDFCHACATITKRYIDDGLTGYYWHDVELVRVWYTGEIDARMAGVDKWYVFETLFRALDLKDGYTISVNPDGTVDVKKDGQERVILGEDWRTI